MTNNVQLISEATLKKYSLINDNVDACYIAPAIQKAQDMGLQPLIGTYLYDKICSLIIEGTIGDDANVNHKTLLDVYITPYLCQKVMSEIQIPLFAKIRNSGILNSTDQQTQQLTMQEVEYIKRNFDQDATFYGTRMVEYLCTNNTLFPEYRQIRDSADMQADHNSFNTHIVL